MDILDFAINMEIEGNKYYSKHAQKNKDNSLFVVFNLLAEDELKHAELLKSKKKDAAYSVKNIKKSKADNLFSDKDQKISDITASPEQLDAYRFAMDKEKESIDLYTELAQKTEGGLEFFEFLISEEEKHFNLLFDLVELLSRPKDWVESAEFGTREDY